MIPIAWLVWNPDPICFVIPFVDWPVRWYGLFFALGFILAYLFLQKSLEALFIKHKVFKETESPKIITQKLMDTLTWYVVIATIVGARLGHVLFYDFNHYLAHPLSIFKTWEGGLASHGGGIAIPIAIFLFYHRYLRPFPSISLLMLMDRVAVVVPLGAFWIRLGNFFNQEIVGTPSVVPWAIIFGNPQEGCQGIPLHPVQLYEGFAYLFFFFLLFFLSKRELKPGFCCGMMFFLIFTTRLVLEMFKQSQGILSESLPIEMGQLLSIPFVLIGITLIFLPEKKIELRVNE